MSRSSANKRDSSTQIQMASTLVHDLPYNHSAVRRVTHELVQQKRLVFLDPVLIVHKHPGWVCKTFRAQNVQTGLVVQYKCSTLYRFASKNKAKAHAFIELLYDLGLDDCLNQSVQRTTNRMQRRDKQRKTHSALYYDTLCQNMLDELYRASSCLTSRTLMSKLKADGVYPRDGRIQPIHQALYHLAHLGYVERSVSQNSVLWRA